MFKLILLLCCYISGILCAVQITPVSLPKPAKYPQNPFWDELDQALYFPDILGNTLYRYSYGNDKIVSVQADGINLPGIFMPAYDSNGTYITSTGRSAVIINWDGTTPTASNAGPLFKLAPKKYLNSAWVLNNGQFYFGSYDNKYCSSRQRNSVFKYSGSGHLSTASNGRQGVAGMVSIGSLVYWVEPCTESLWVAVQSKNGELSDPVPVMSLDDGNDQTFPIGLAAGNLYVCGYESGLIYKIDPVERKITDRLQLPIENPTSVTFGGPNYDIMYVTSSPNKYDFETLTRSGTANGGDLLKITGLGVTGVRSYRPAL